MPDTEGMEDQVEIEDQVLFKLAQLFVVEVKKTKFNHRTRVVEPSVKHEFA